MFLFVLDKIEAIVKRYTEAYIFTNNAKNLAVELKCHLDEESKEFLLNDIDNELRDWINFSHTYDPNRGWLQITFK